MKKLGILFWGLLAVSSLCIGCNQKPKKDRKCKCTRLTMKEANFAEKLSKNNYQRFYNMPADQRQKAMSLNSVKNGVGRKGRYNLKVSKVNPNQAVEILSK